VSDYYTNVDRSPSPHDAIDWQRRLDSWPAIVAYKQRTYDLLDGLELVVDVGSGPGGDAVALGVERCLGLDFSRTMCRAAFVAGVRVAQADAQRLPLRSDAFDGARADRVVQHIPDPDAALSELVRVVRPGGRVVVSDPDQETLSVHVPGIPTEMCAAVKELRRDVGYRHGHIAAQYPGRFSAMGLLDVTVDAFAILLTDPADAFGLESWPRTWRGAGHLDWTDEDLLLWEGALAGEMNGFTLSLTYLVVSGRKPG
jgi:SAM-dependent methyltransferase